MTFDFATFEGQAEALRFGLKQDGHMTLAWMMEEHGYPEVADFILARNNYLADLFDGQGDPKQPVQSRLWLEIWKKCYDVRGQPKPRQGWREPAEVEGPTKYRKYKMKKTKKTEPVFEAW